MFKDKIGIRIYWNTNSDEIRRDLPLAVINEPVEDQLGGGLTGGWAGTWGANMFDEERTKDSRGDQGTELSSKHEFNI